MKDQGIIAIDVDDVIAAHAEAFVAFSNRYYGTNLTIEDYEDRWELIWNVDRGEIERRAREFHAPESVQRYRRIQQADKTLERLSQDYELVVVTARPKQLIEPTYTWLEEHFVGVFNAVHFVPIWEPDNKVTKADICNKIGAVYLIDDVPHHCNIAAEGGIKALLFGDYNWNRKEPIKPGVTRVSDWLAVQEYFCGSS